MNIREWFLVVWNGLLVVLSVFLLQVAFAGISWGIFGGFDPGLLDAIQGKADWATGTAMLFMGLIGLVAATFILREVVRYVRASAYWQQWWKKAKMARASLFSK